MFQLIVISNPTMLLKQAAIIQQLFEEGLAILHLRKREQKEQEIRQLLDEIPAAYHNRIALHGFHDVADGYGIHRLHFTEQHRVSHSWENEPPKQVLSTSVHDLLTLQQLPSHFSYAFFSPV